MSCWINKASWEARPGWHGWNIHIRGPHFQHVTVRRHSGGSDCLFNKLGDTWQKLGSCIALIKQTLIWMKEMDSHLAEDVGLQLSGPETIRRGVIKKERPSQREWKNNHNCFLWILNVLAEVGLLTIALGHVKKLFFPDHHDQGNGSCFKPGQERGTKSLLQNSGQPSTHGVSADSRDSQLPLPETRVSPGHLGGVGGGGLLMYSNSRRSCSGLGASWKQGYSSPKNHVKTGPFQITSAVRFW